MIELGDDFGLIGYGKGEEKLGGFRGQNDLQYYVPILSEVHKVPLKL
jgi:hypothetical protein